MCNSNSKKLLSNRTISQYLFDLLIYENQVGALKLRLSKNYEEEMSENDY